MTLEESVARAERVYLEEDEDKYVITQEDIEEAKLEYEER